MNVTRTIAGFTLAGAVATGGTFLVDAQINPYTDLATTLEISAPSIVEAAGENTVELSKEEPAVTLKKWNGETALTVKYDGVKAAGNRAFLTDRVEWKGATEEVHAYPIDATIGMEDGGFEIAVLLTEKPATNQFNFSISGAENLDFFYQPALTKEEIDRGDQRPDNVVGSYAVYYKEHLDHVEGQTNYATGKAYHIYRPKAVDAKGNETWADLSYINGTLTVTVPQDYLDNAAYPVTVDPTFGYTSVGGSFFAGLSQFSRGFANISDEYTASSGDTATQISLYGKCTSATGSGEGIPNLGIYNTSGVTPSSLQTSALATTFSSTAGTWTSAAVSFGLSSSVKYSIAFAMSAGGGCSGAGIDIAYDTLSTSYSSNTTGGLPSSWTQFATGNNRFSMYATYTTIAQLVILTANPGAGNQTWTVPADFGSLVKIECIGAGGDGGPRAAGPLPGSGGGGGAYASTTSGTFHPGDSITYSIGAHATTTAGSLANETYINSTASSTATLSCAFGRPGTTSTVGGAGGTAAFSTGNVFAGGNGGVTTQSANRGGGGGGGSAGPIGVGKNGGAGGVGGPIGGGGGGGSNGGSASNGAGGGAGGGNGGNGTTGAGGGAGATVTPSAAVAGSFGGGGGGGGPTNTLTRDGAAGGNDTSFDLTHGAGGGGGGSAGTSTVTVLGGAGGTYGGGGGGISGGASSVAGTGGQGIIVITYLASAVTTAAANSQINIQNGLIKLLNGVIIIR